ncbi:MAG: hypothetical protein P9L94_07580 [Candidatus Hinthialibacter antarcticus]|nr:hypothetical protein [Candidatus Hinthialibacter antarcticus]
MDGHNFDYETYSGILKFDNPIQAWAQLGERLCIKGVEARTEASRVVPMPDTAKDQEFTKKRQKTQFNL